MTVVRRIAKVFAAGVGSLLYVWYAAVRNVALVKRRKAARRKAPRR